MMDISLIEFYEERDEESINAVIEESSSSVSLQHLPKPMTIFYEEKYQLVCDHIVRNIEVGNPIMFNDEEILLGGRGITVGRGCHIRFSLGNRFQGIKTLLLVVRSKERFSLGYESPRREILEIMFEKKKKRMACLKGMELQDPNIYFLYLYETFRSRGYIHPHLPKGRDHEYEVVVNVVKKEQ
ncbi:Uncharacterized protein TCM_040592 [Theobroma cacao]|uniref:Uncharacterized protein n=1 Tax=Theobroma cacao TaxID=3641 RepID=A0A061GZ64_THECC|nr:Uncharacterized protein TCM_040592 [Theobroma cacao]